ncbi:MAG: aminopeptidase P family protein [Clostridiaceae bacterium]|nr:aminopeptidase P family protein [Clostridiaceae bacterium]
MFLKRRLENLQNNIKGKSLDAMLITNAINLTYISGFRGTAGYGIVTRERAFLLTDFRYTQQAHKQAPFFEVIQFEGDAMDSINDVLKKNNVRSMGFESRHLSCLKYEQFKSKLCIKDFFPVTDLVESLREIKDESEIEKMRKAAEIADSAFYHILHLIKPGITENEIALELEYFMKKNGAKALSFDTIVASGVRSSLPHGQPSDKRIEAGDLVVLDFGCVYEGYCSDMTRTIGVGSLNEEQKKIYNIVLEAQMKGLNVLKPGITGKEVDRAARDIISSHGYGQNFGHGLGHGVGCEVHEAPRLSVNAEEVLKPGMVVTVEPGIYINDFGGVRIEDMVLITSDGIENFTSSPKELIIV